MEDFSVFFIFYDELNIIGFLLAGQTQPDIWTPSLLALVGIELGSMVGC